MSTRGLSSPTASLFEGRAGSTPVALTFLALSILVTGAGLVAPDFKSLLGGVVGRPGWWPALLSAFQHGWPRFPALLHLGLNAILILECGRPCERLLGSVRFLLLTATAAAAGVVSQLLSEPVAGASQVIWAWGPPLAVAWVWPRQRRAVGGEGSGRIAGVLSVMYVLVTVLMTALPYLAGWRGSLLRAFWIGNRYHLVATCVGAIAAILWSRPIQRRLVQLAAS